MVPYINPADQVPGTQTGPASVRGVCVCVCVWGGGGGGAAARSFVYIHVELYS